MPTVSNALIPTPGSRTAVPAPHDVVRQFVRQTRDASITVIDSCESGYSGNVPFRIDTAQGALVAKVSPAAMRNDDARLRFAQEQLGCVFAARLGLGAAVVAAESGLLVTRYVAGTHVQPQDLRDPKLLVRILGRLRTLHAAPFDTDKVPALQSLRAKFYTNVRRAVVRGILTPAQRQLAAQVDLADAALRKLTKAGITHGDMQGRNIRVGIDGHVTFIDFENWGVGESMQDLAHFSMEMLGPDADLAELLNLYHPEHASDLLPRLQLCVFIAQATRALEWARWGHEEAWAKECSPQKLVETNEVLTRTWRWLKAQGLVPSDGGRPAEGSRNAR